MKEHLVARTRTLETIALVEALKGAVVLAASLGLLSYLHHDARHLVHEMLQHFGLRPDAPYPMMLRHYADVLEDTSLRSLAMLALGYASLRFVEAYGLWHDTAWGEWLGALSGGIYIPFEIRHIVHSPSIFGIAIFLLNVAIVAFLAFRLYRRRRVAWLMTLDK